MSGIIGIYSIYTYSGSLISVAYKSIHPSILPLPSFRTVAYVDAKVEYESFSVGAGKNCASTENEGKENRNWKII